MYNLIRFFLRYYLFIFFVVLETFCFYLIYQNKHYNEVAYLNAAYGFRNRMYATYQGANDYLHLRNISDSLANENAALREALYDSKYDNRIDSGSVSDSTSKTIQHFTYITARVIKNSVNKSTNYVYLDRGKLQQVKAEMGVINKNGVVGKVISVTDNYCVVMSVLGKDYVSVKFKKNEFFGNLKWNGIGTTTATLENIPKHVKVTVGDTLVTSGFSQMYPRNIMVGIVKSMETKPEENFLDVTVTLSTDFGNLSYVYIVNNIRKEEIQQLDSFVDTLDMKND